MTPLAPSQMSFRESFPRLILEECDENTRAAIEYLETSIWPTLPTEIQEELATVNLVKSLELHRSTAIPSNNKLMKQLSAYNPRSNMARALAVLARLYFGHRKLMSNKGYMEVMAFWPAHATIPSGPARGVNLQFIQPHRKISRSGKTATPSKGRPSAASLPPEPQPETTATSETPSVSHLAAQVDEIRDTLARMQELLQRNNPEPLSSTRAELPAQNTQIQPAQVPRNETQLHGITRLTVPGTFRIILEAIVPSRSNEATPSNTGADSGNSILIASCVRNCTDHFN
jgi:hypothetical protein